jgi:flagellar secretion chaperone FliS
MFAPAEAPAGESGIYQESQILTASQEELILMLYEGAIKFTNQSLQAMEDQQAIVAGQMLVRAQRIVHYLSIVLNTEAGGELAKNLRALYTFLLDLFTQANLRQNGEKIRQGVGVLRTLRDAWKQGVLKQDPA